MKISYKTMPALEYLKKGMLGKIPIPIEDMPTYQMEPLIFHVLGDAFKKYVNKFRGKIYKASDNFLAAYQKADPKLTELYVDMVKSDSHKFEEAIVSIYGDTVVFYYSEFKANDPELNCFYMVSDANGTIYEFYVQDNSLEKGLIGWVSARNVAIQIEGDERNYPFQTESYLVARVASMATLCMFIKYAEVETKIVLGKSKRRFGDPYRNDTDFPITYLDSKWFTNIIRSEGFSVRGHFRLQPKKIDGEWTKELIWIADFEKHGYTSKARILNAE
jgi:hypothetical protein